MKRTAHKNLFYGVGRNAGYKHLFIRNILADIFKHFFLAYLLCHAAANEFQNLFKSIFAVRGNVYCNVRRKITQCIRLPVTAKINRHGKFYRLTAAISVAFVNRQKRHSINRRRVLGNGAAVFFFGNGFEAVKGHTDFRS